MTLDAIRGQVRSGEREIGGIVVKTIGRIAGWVTSQTGRTTVGVPPDPVVLVVGLRIGVATGAGKFRVIRWVGMAIGTGIPLVFVLATVNWEILGVVVKSGRRPGGFAVAGSTIRGELQVYVVRIGGPVVIRGVTARASVRRAVVIPVVTGSALVRDLGMRTVQRIIIVVNREGSRLPARRRGMAHRAIRRDIQGCVVRIGTSVVIGRVATRAGIGRIGIVPVVTSGAIAGNLGMSARQWIHRIVIKSSGRPGGLTVASGTIHGELRGGVVRIGRRVIIGRMTTRTGIRRVVVIPVVAGSAIVRNLGVRPVQGVIIIVDREARRRPARVGSVAHRTICGQVQVGVTGVEAGVVIGRMAGHTLRGCPCVTIRVALVAIGTQVRAREREPRVVVVEGIACIAGRVTSQTGRIFIHIPVYADVGIVCNRVDMAIGAGEFRKIGWILMAFIALHPLALVFATVDREILGIVLEVLRGRPVRVGGMAADAIRREIGLLVVGVYSSLIIRLVAGYATRGRIGKIAPDMAFRTIHIRMPLGQRKEIVLHFSASPAAAE